MAQKTRRALELVADELRYQRSILERIERALGDAPDHKEQLRDHETRLSDVEKRLGN